MKASRYIFATLALTFSGLLYAGETPEKDVKTANNIKKESFEEEKKRLEKLPMLTEHSLKNIRENRWEDSFNDLHQKISDQENIRIALSVSVEKERLSAVSTK